MVINEGSKALTYLPVIRVEVTRQDRTDFFVLARNMGGQLLVDVLQQARPDFF